MDAERLLRMSQEELDDLFRASPSGDIPRGEGAGTVIVAPGTAVSDPAARLSHALAWRGKVLDPERGALRNRISPFGIPAIQAKVYFGASLFDGKKAIILDYSKTSLIAHWVRDEIRLVSPSLYLGVVFWDNAKVLNFALKFSQ